MSTSTSNYKLSNPEMDGSVFAVFASDNEQRDSRMSNMSKVTEKRE